MTIQEKINRKVALIEGRLDIYLQKENFVLLSATNECVKALTRNSRYNSIFQRVYAW